MSTPRFKVGDKVICPSNNEVFHISLDNGDIQRYEGAYIFIISKIEKISLDWFVNIKTTNGNDIIGNRYQYYFAPLPNQCSIDEDLFTL